MVQVCCQGTYIMGKKS